MSWVMHDVDFYNSLLKELAFKPDRSEFILFSIRPLSDKILGPTTENLLKVGKYVKGGRLI